MSSLSIPSSVGHLTIDADSETIVGVRWADDPHGEPTPLLREAARQLEAYFAGALTAFDLPLKPRGSAFQQKVWAAMRAIPYGQTRSYAELAEAVDSGPRAIGGACGKNPIPVIVPCHRVLSRGGIGGYSGGEGLPTKLILLALEGARLPS
ncbi:MAG: methylated-DNA--[protein]-cysteine S-methyltransferase [Alphaproteobacteria bacterium]|nr:methylated-DNA--[protein]-cysteine S-methyltransferase [Alphaproteobacteria bacterium]